MPLSLTCWLWFPPRDCSLPVLLACCESLRRGFGSGALFGLLRSFWGLFGLLPPAVCGPCRAGRHGAASERLAATATAAAAAAAAAGECRESGGAATLTVTTISSSWLPAISPTEPSSTYATANCKRLPTH